MPEIQGAERKVVDWLAANGSAMLALLGDLVNIDSGTADTAGVEAVGKRVTGFLRSAGIDAEPIAAAPYGRGVRAEVPGSAPSDKTMLLMGHLDTVFPAREAERRPFKIAAGRAYGPGVADMKSGLVLNSFIAAAFKACGGNPLPLVALYTGDEEVGSPGYRPIIEAEARKARYAFNAEPGRVSGNVVTARRGGVFMRLSVRGKAAHSGIDIRAGVSAVEEVAHKILALHALNDFDRGVTVNVGVVHGGQSVNTTAPSAEALIDLRFARAGDRDRAMAAIHTIVTRSWVAGSSADLQITGEFVPMEATPASMDLFRLYQSAASDLGVQVDAEATGGCADSGFAAAIGAVTLCGLGPVGGYAHSADEYVEIDSIVPRAQALALTILRLGATAAASASSTTDDAGARAPQESAAVNQGDLRP